jgi:hypothetical protein
LVHMQGNVRFLKRLWLNYERQRVNHY